MGIAPFYVNDCNLAPVATGEIMALLICPPGDRINLCRKPESKPEK